MKKLLYLGDDNEEEDDKSKELFVSGTDIIEIDDNLAGENYALDKGIDFFPPIYHPCKGLLGVSCV